MGLWMLLGGVWGCVFVSGRWERVYVWAGRYLELNGLNNMGWESFCVGRVEP